jgi:hypothetical protein
MSLQQICGFGSRISNESGSGSRVLMTKKLKKKSTAELFFYLVCSKIALHLCPSYRRCIQPRKKTSSTSKNEIYLLFSMFVGHFCSLESGYGSRDHIESGSGFTALRGLGVLICPFWQKLSRKSVPNLQYFHRNLFSFYFLVSKS